MKGKRRSLTVGVIALIVLSAVVGIALGESEDYFDVEECKCTELKNKGLILDEGESASQTSDNQLYCIYRDDNKVSEVYIGYIADETEFERLFQREKALTEDYINQWENSDKVRIVEKRIVETDDYRLLSCLVYGVKYQDPYYFGVKEIFYLDQYHITLNSFKEEGDFANDVEFILAYDELERCAKEIIDNKEGKDYFIYPLLVDEVVVGEELQLSVKSGMTTIENSEITWKIAYHESINPNILPNRITVGKIDRKGKFTAVNVGTCTVRATIGDKWVDKKITVKCCDEKQTGDIKELKYLYDSRIPMSNFAKDRMAGKISYPFDVMTPGVANNILSIKYDRYKKHTCGGYQGDVLNFLHDVQADPEECKLLNGYEFGPIEGSYGGHHAVVVYPNGTDWKKTGTVFDPWPAQYPMTFTIARWEERFSPINGDTSASYRLKYPTTKSPDDYGGLSWRMPEFLWDSTIGALFCPVDLLITDEQGRRLGVLHNGSMVYEIPNSSLLKVPNEEGEHQWYFVLDPVASDTYSFEITGTEDGTFEFLTSNAEDNTFHYYGENQIKKDEKAEAVIDINDPVGHLTLSNGTQIGPEVLEVIIEPSSSGDLKINTIRPITVMVTVIIVGFVMVSSRMKRRKP